MVISTSVNAPVDRRTFAAATPTTHNASGPVETFTPSAAEDEEPKRGNKTLFYLGMLNAANGLIWSTLGGQPTLGYAIGMGGVALMFCGQKKFNVGTLQTMNGLLFAGLLNMPLAGGILGASGLALAALENR